MWPEAGGITEVCGHIRNWIKSDECTDPNWVPVWHDALLSLIIPFLSIRRVITALHLRHSYRLVSYRCSTAGDVTPPIIDMQDKQRSNDRLHNSQHHQPLFYILLWNRMWMQIPQRWYPLECCCCPPSIYLYSKTDTHVDYRSNVDLLAFQ